MSSLTSLKRSKRNSELRLRRLLQLRLPELAQEQLAVEDVRAGKVRITGIVSRPELKQRAESIVKNQEGVSDMVSTITVDEKLKDKRINMDDM